MNFDFSYTHSPVSSLPVTLTTVYSLQADPSYDVWKNETNYGEFIALRTIGGRGSIKIEGLDEMTAYPGTLIFFEHKLIRHYYCSGDAWDFWWLCFTADKGISLPLNKMLLIDTVDRETADCNTCLELLKGDDPESRSLASATLNMLLCKWMYYLNKKEVRNAHKAAIDKVLNLMHSSMPDYVTVREMAAVAGLSERRFREVFENIMDMPPKRYYDMLRINTAKELLRNTPLSIGQIALRLGFSSQFHFTRAFRKECGIPPSCYRKL